MLLAVLLVLLLLAGGVNWNVKRGYCCCGGEDSVLTAYIGH
jgi:hypothetical protein